MKEKAIILFDGVCNLCNGVVQFVIKHDPDAYFSFAPLQSDKGRQILAEKEKYPDGKHPASIRSIVLIENGHLYTESTAALRIARHLSGMWKYLSVLLLLPRFMRDPVYHFIARNRYRWFGKKEECMVPDPEIKERFM